MAYRGRTPIVDRSFLTDTEVFQCQQCRLETAKAQKVVTDIFGRDRRDGQVVITKSRMEFCSATCASHAQYAREG